VDADLVYDVLLDYESPGRLRMLWRWTWVAITQISILEIFIAATEPRLDCTVVVVRRSDGASMATYDWKFYSEALNHVRDLRRRLNQMTSFEFETDLGLFGV
jgi:hypothetical protein